MPKHRSRQDGGSTPPTSTIFVQGASKIPWLWRPRVFTREPNRSETGAEPGRRINAGIVARESRGARPSFHSAQPRVIPAVALCPANS